ncbi:uncharacterized protein LOC132624178 [Lycium barbarum]|uniref:uncharacterized protein LOC132624178 n=1 Tax=Lycium barbarum TaxID=112863 RepID=UPI00293F1A1B|nr:uncharacterized protein LOC132624178 [Lycium barbarum]
MIQHPDSRYIDLVKVEIRDQPTHCAFVEAETNGKPWYVDIKMYLEKGEYLERITINQKKTIRKLANGFFSNKNVLYKRTPDLGLLSCIDSIEATRLIEEVHAETCGPQMNGFMLVKKILRAGYYWMTMENDCRKFVQKCHKCQIHGDLIKVPPIEQNAMTSPWPFAAWGMDVIGPIEPATLNKHCFIFVVIDYFMKWVEATSFTLVTKKVVVDFVRNNIICRFGIPQSIITDNGANLNSHLMNEMCTQFRITHQHSTAYWPQMNGALEDANRNIKKILRKMIYNYKDWHEKLPYALLGYCTTARTLIGATPYLLVYGIEAVISAEVELSSLRIIQEAELDDAEWIRRRYEQLALIDEKQMIVVCHGQL